MWEKSRPTRSKSAMSPTAFFYPCLSFKWGDFSSPPEVSWAKIRSTGLLSKPHSLSPGGEWAPSVSLLASPLSGKKQRDGRQDESQEEREEKRGIPGPLCFMYPVYSIVSLRNLLLASYHKSTIHSSHPAGGTLLAMDKQASDPHHSPCCFLVKDRI